MNQEVSLDCFAALAMTRFKVTAQFLVKLKAFHEPADVGWAKRKRAQQQRRVLGTLRLAQPTVDGPCAFRETEERTRSAFLRVVQ